MSVLKLKTSLMCNGPESDKAEYLLQTRDTIPADVCTHLVLAVHQGLVGLVLHVLGQPGHSSHYKHYITRPTSGTPWRGRCCTADTPGPRTSPPGTDNTHCRI